MKKNALFLTAVLVFGWQGLSLADTSSVDALIQKLEDKGILTDQEATQIKGQIASNEKDSQQATFKSMLPDWINNIKLTGDMRLRYQSQERDVRNYGPGASHTLIAPHDRGRVRARLNFEDQINDKFKFIFGIGTDGTGGNNGSGTSVYNFARSNNQSFGGNGTNNVNEAPGSFAKDFIVLNKAYGEYKPNANWRIAVGKMDNPIWEPYSVSGERFLWDPNITPEGGAVQYEKKINDYITPFSTDAVYVIKDQGNSDTDAWMYVLQEGVKGNLTDKAYYKAAGSWYGINNPYHTPMDQRSNDLTNTTLVQGSTAMGCPVADQISANKINGVYNCYEYSYNAIVAAVDLGLNDPFGELLPSPIYIPQIGVRGEYVRNPESIIPSDQKNGWEIGGYMGNSALNGWGTWQISTDYRVMEQNAWMDVFPDFDQYTGDTDVAGWRSELDIGLAKNVWMDFNIFDFHIYKPFVNPALNEGTYTTGNNQITNDKNREILFQVDLNMKF